MFDLRKVKSFGGEYVYRADVLIFGEHHGKILSDFSSLEGGMNASAIVWDTKNDLKKIRFDFESEEVAENFFMMGLLCGYFKYD